MSDRVLQGALQDALNRRIDYMRVSITDRCNLRCRYCMPEDLPFIPHERILRYEEILRLCGIFAEMGVQNVRVTGGEPLVRKGCVDFIRALKAVPGIVCVTMTTNAVLLEPHVPALAALRLNGLNISLDSLDPETYRKITGRDTLREALGSLHTALGAGLRVKVNCVPVRGLNEAEIIPVAKLAEANPVNVRFIERMPAGADGVQGVPADEILGLLLGAYPDLTPDTARRGFGPARYFKSGRLKGAIGIISAVSDPFCSACNRLRLTSEGFLQLCLCHDGGLDLRGLLRGGASCGEIKAAIAKAVLRKPARHAFDQNKGIGKMSEIGG